MSLRVACGLKGRSISQLRGEENVQNAQAPCLGAQGWRELLCGKVLFDLPPLFLCNEIIPQATPLLPVAVSSFLGVLRAH